MPTLSKFLLAAAFCNLSVLSAMALPVVHTSDFISDASRTGFNGFEFIPTDLSLLYTGGSGPYSEDGIEVEQINPTNPIWVSYLFPGSAGNHAWYPNGGDNGFTRISLSGGANFEDVGFHFGTGGQTTNNSILFELYDNGALVLSGSAPLGGSSNYLGFGGGGFDTIFVRDTHDSSPPLGNGGYQALAVDSIEIRGASVSVPETGTTIAMFLLAMVGTICAKAHVSGGKTRIQ